MVEKIKLTSKVSLLAPTNEMVIYENREKITVKLENQLMAILLLLYKYKGALVEKELFIEEIWKKNYLTGEKALTKNIFKLRKIIRDHRVDNEFYIETIPKKGYRLCITNSNSSAGKKSRNNLIVTVIAATAIAISIIFNWQKEPENNKVQMITLDENGNDTILFLGEEKLKVFRIDTQHNEVISLEELKN